MIFVRVDDLVLGAVNMPPDLTVFTKEQQCWAYVFFLNFWAMIERFNNEG